MFQNRENALYLLMLRKYKGSEGRAVCVPLTVILRPPMEQINPTQKSETSALVAHYQTSAFTFHH